MRAAGGSHADCVLFHRFDFRVIPHSVHGNNRAIIYDGKGGEISHPRNSMPYSIEAI